MKHIDKFDDFKINEYNIDTYDNIISGIKRNDPKGDRIKQTAMYLKQKQENRLSKSIIYQTNGEKFSVQVAPPKYLGSNIIGFAALDNPNPIPAVGEGVYALMINSINVKITNGMCDLYKVQTGDVREAYADRKSANWMTKEINNLLEKMQREELPIRITPNQIPQF